MWESERDWNSTDKYPEVGIGERLDLYRQMKRWELGRFQLCRQLVGKVGIGLIFVGKKNTVGYSKNATLG